MGILGAVRCLAHVPNVSTLVCMCDTPFLPFIPLNGYLIKGFAISQKNNFFGHPVEGNFLGSQPPIPLEK